VNRGRAGLVEDAVSSFQEGVNVSRGDAIAAGTATRHHSRAPSGSIGLCDHQPSGDGWRSFHIRSIGPDLATTAAIPE